MRTKQRRTIAELPLIAVTFIVLAVWSVIYSATLWTVRGLLHVTGTDHPAGGAA